MFLGEFKMGRIIFPKLSYRIMGVLFVVHNELGPACKERHYQRAIRERFKKEEINFREQVEVAVGSKVYVGCYYMDFVVEDKIILEIKAVPRFSRDNILQVLRYLKETGMELGILANFSRRQLLYRRILRGFRY